MRLSVRFCLSVSLVDGDRALSRWLSSYRSDKAFVVSSLIVVLIFFLAISFCFVQIKYFVSGFFLLIVCSFGLLNNCDLFDASLSILTWFAFC